MRQFISFVSKEFFHIFRDKRTVLILLGMPVVQIILFGFAITTEVKNVRVAVLAPSVDEVTRQITERIGANEYLNVTEMLRDASEIETVFREGRADLVVVFSDNFSNDYLHTGEAAVQLIADGTDPNTARTLVGYAVSILSDFQRDMSRGHIMGGTIVPEVKMLYNPGMKSAYNFVPGVMGLILILICAMMTSISIVREKETGTMEVLLVSPVRPIFVILAKMIPYLLLSCVNVVSILLLSVYVLGIPVSGSLFLLSMVCLLYIIVALSLGLLISMICRTQMTAMLVSGMLLMMPVILFSGMIYPIESMPLPLQWFSNIIPAKWFIMAVKKVMIEGLGVTYVVKEMCVLAGMAAFLLVVSLKKFNIRLDEK